MWSSARYNGCPRQGNEDFDDSDSESHISQESEDSQTGKERVSPQERTEHLDLGA